MAATKFLFDVDFGNAARPREDAKVSAAAHDAALKDAEARGLAAGLASAEAREKSDAERKRAAACERVATMLAGLGASLDTLERKLEAEAVEVAFAVARKLAPELVAREPETEIAALAKGCLRELRTAPHVAVRLNDKQHSALRPILEDIARTSGFEGRLVVLGEAEVGPGDCRIEWADGGLVRDRARAEQAVGDAVARYVAARKGPPRTPMFGE